MDNKGHYSSQSAADSGESRVTGGSCGSLKQMLREGQTWIDHNHMTGTECAAPWGYIIPTLCRDCSSVCHLYESCHPKTGRKLFVVVIPK